MRWKSWENWLNNRFLSLLHNTPSGEPAQTQILQEEKISYSTAFFHLKLNDLIADFTQRKVFYLTQAFFYILEFKKPGLPQGHFLLILHPKTRPHLCKNLWSSMHTKRKALENIFMLKKEKTPPSTKIFSHTNLPIHRKFSSLRIRWTRKYFSLQYANIIH